MHGKFASCSLSLSFPITEECRPFLVVSVLDKSSSSSSSLSPSLFWVEKRFSLFLLELEEDDDEVEEDEDEDEWALDFSFFVPIPESAIASANLDFAFSIFSSVMMIPGLTTHIKYQCSA